MAHGVGAFIAWVFGSMIEFFVQAVYGWFFTSVWSFFEHVMYLLHPVRPWYQPLKLTYENLGFFESFSYNITKCFLNEIIMPEVVSIFYNCVPSVVDSPFEPVYQERRDMVYTIEARDVFKKFFGSDYVPIHKGSVAGLVGLSFIPRLFYPKVSSFLSLTPFVVDVTGYWDDSSKQGRMFAYFTPVVPWLSVKPSLLPFNFLSKVGVNNYLSRLIAWITQAYVTPKIGSGSISSGWAFEYVSGVSKSARVLSSNALNIIYAWCGKLGVSILFPVVKEAPPMSKFLEQLLKKIGIYKVVITMIKFFNKLSINEWNETFPVNPIDSAEIYMEVTGLSSRRLGFNSLFNLSSSSELSILSCSAGRYFTSHPSVIVGSSSSHPYMFPTIVAEEPVYWMSYVLYLPSPLSDILSEDDAGTVICALFTRANEDGIKLALTSWVPSIMPFDKAGVWDEFRKLWANVVDVLDKNVDKIGDKMSFIIEDNPYAPYSKSIISSAYSLVCYKVALSDSIPDFDAVINVIKSGSSGDAFYEGAARVVGLLTFFLSYYLGGGPPGMLLFWWSPQINPPCWVSRSPEMCTVDPVALTKGTIELLLSLPFTIREKFEDKISFINRTLKNVIGG